MAKFTPLHAVFLPWLIILTGISSAFGQIVTQPAGLPPGTQYRLAFVTDATTQAVSADIATYNSFVTTQANSAPSLFALHTSWYVIGSTVTVSAITNTQTTPGTGVPIYGLNGTLVASTYTALWSDNLTNHIDTTPSDSASSSLVFTGTHTDGSIYSNFALGSSGLDLGDAGSIAAPLGSDDWIDAWSDPSTDFFPIYGISAVLTVTPEPGSAALLAVGGALLGFQRRRSA